MTIQERITSDMKTAMKKGESLKLQTLRMIRAQFIELAKRGTDKLITEDDELAVITNAIKKRKESIELFEKAGRTDLSSQESQELSIISAYLPPQMSPDEAESIISKIISESGATSGKDFGKVMGVAMKELKGKIDGKVVQELVRQKLG